MSRRGAADWHREAEVRLGRGDFAGVESACAQVLAREPEHADAHFLRGVAAASSGRAGEGIKDIARAVELDPARADYRAQLAGWLVRLGHDEAAVAAAEGAWSAGPGDALTFDTIGVVMTQAGLHRRAADAFERAVALAPDHPAHLFNHATALRIVGDLGRAEALLERAVTLEPEHWRAHWLLSQLRVQTPERNHVDRLRALLARGAGSVDREVHLRQALAKELDDLGRCAESFAELTAGKSRRRAASAYRFGRDAEILDRIEAVCDRAFVEGGVGRGVEGGVGRGGSGHEALDAHVGHPSDAPIFVVGMPRSGTTLVERMLSLHPDVTTAGELAAFPLAVRHVAGGGRGAWLDAETIDAAAQADARALAESYLARARLRAGRTPHFVDKLPVNFLYAGLIARAFPRARIICLRRGPLDTCLANFRELFAADFFFYEYTWDLCDVARYYARFERLVEHWRAVMPSGRWFEVRYEDLVAAPEPQARRLFEFVGLRWEPGCTAIETNPAPVATASAVQVREPIHGRSVGRWRRYAAQLEPALSVLRAAGIRTEAD